MMKRRKPRYWYVCLSDLSEPHDRRLARVGTQGEARKKVRDLNAGAVLWGGHRAKLYYCVYAPPKGKRRANSPCPLAEVTCD